MTTNLFEYATRNKLRFPSAKGELNIEQLWDVPLRSKDEFNLNDVAKAASQAWKKISEESFVETAKTPEHTKCETVLETIKYVINVKLAEEEASEKRAKNRQKKDELLEALDQKQKGKLGELTEAQLRKKIAEIDD